MFKTFETLEALYQEIEEDKNWTGAESALRNRYPIRFVLFESFNDFGDFVQVCQDHNVLVQSIGGWMKEWQNDKFMTYSQMAEMFQAYIKSIPSNDFVIAPFSEITRFYDNVRYTEFDSLLKTIRLIQSPEDSQRNHQRVYVPIIGMQNKVNKFKNDPNIHIWEYRSDKENQNYHLILTSGTTYGVKGLENGYTLCADLRQWVDLWKCVGTKIQRQIICTSKCIFNNAGNAQPDNAFEYTLCHNAYEFLKYGLKLDLEDMAPSTEDLPYWEQFAGCVDVTTFQFDEFVGQRFNVSSINDETTFVQIWLGIGDDFSRWLLKAYYLWKQPASGYLSRVLRKCQSQSSSELFSLVATLIFDEPMDEACLYQRQQMLAVAKVQNIQITDISERKVKAKLTAMAADPQRGYYCAMKYMSPLTLSEQCLMIEWVGKGHVDKSQIKSLYPSFYDYLTKPTLHLDNNNNWINLYFQEYSASKVADTMTESLLAMVKENNASQVKFETWRNQFKTVKTILHNRHDIDKYYWIDGLGVDWIPFITKVIEKHIVDGVYLNEIYVATAALPTITSVNKAELEDLSSDKLEKIGDLDHYAHTAKSYPEYLIEELRIVEQAISKVLSQYNGKKLAFVSDHGISYMPQIGRGLNLSGMEPNHAGRCATWKKGAAQADKSYMVLEDGRTLCALTPDSLSSKTPLGQGAHGGTLPEEVLVPIIIVSGQKNANTCSAQLQTNEIASNNPVLRYTIKGMSIIDTPYVSYNGVDYALHKLQGEIYESERLNLVGTASTVTLVINDFTQTDLLHINTGVQEDDLFGF